MNTGNTEIRFKSSLDQISLLFPNMHVSKTCKFTINCRIMNFTHIEATTPFSRRTQSQRQLHIKDMSFQEQFISRMILLWTNSYQWHFISRETHVKHTSYQGKLISRALHIKTDSLWTNSIVKNTLIFKRNLSQRPLHIKDNFYQAHFISTDVFGPKCCYCTVYAATAYHICHILLTAILYKGCGYHIN